MNLTNANYKYRHDIDGLRAIAVFAVIIFHFGLISNGYLGVDVFFVISGYLITNTIFNKLNDNQFSLIDFYIRRVRRIIPLVLFITAISLPIGIFTMLPDDLENLAQSIVATNLFSNNILQAITTKDYWGVVNEFKPLMHTWSLGIEEQYYLLYPLLFLWRGDKYRFWIPLLLIILTITSLILYFLPYEYHQKFYYLPFRFYELSIGGIAAIYLRNRLLTNRYSVVFIISLLAILFFDISLISQQWKIPIVVLLSLGIIISANENSKLSKFILSNKIMVFAGLISFSLYMWHQFLLAFTRYFIVQDPQILHLILIFILTVFLSILSYKFIEQPFRNKNKINLKTLLFTLILTFITITSYAFYVYLQAGVLKNVPELDITKSQIVKKLHAQYNGRINAHNKNFSNADKLRVLVIGNSFARDWANVLLESKHKDSLEISYTFDPFGQKDFFQRSQAADIIFYSTASKSNIRNLKIDESKLYVIGTKSFGTNSGIFYNYSGDDYFKQRTKMEKGYFESNEYMRKVWGKRYIDYIGSIIDADKTVPVFTPDHKFISQDTIHLTKAGARYFAKIFETKLTYILKLTQK